jgi:hypothetical protein
MQFNPFYGDYASVQHEWRIRHLSLFSDLLDEKIAAGK